MNKWISKLLVITGILGLVGVRFLEDQLFYDPFLSYFKQTHKAGDFPDFSWLPLVMGYLFRFILNLIFSLVVVQFLFQNRQWTIQAALLMILVFLVTFPIYLYCIYTEFSWGSLFSFYMRRFVIQPLALLLIIPIFYYRKATLAKA